MRVFTGEGWALGESWRRLCSLFKKYEKRQVKILIGVSGKVGEMCGRCRHECKSRTRCKDVYRNNLYYFNLILGSHMQQSNEAKESEGAGSGNLAVPKASSSEEASPSQGPANRHLAFEKNYPKNIFIPLIEHLGERGLQKHYEQCVGTRQSFEGKNVVSLGEIHRVMSQDWFQEGINLPALLSNLSNKILMNSKIKKKLFHLLLIRELFALPLHDPREFKKQVSKKANEVSQSRLPHDALFEFPSALIYLLSLLAQGLSRNDPPSHPRDPSQGGDPTHKYYQDNSQQSKSRQKEISSKQQYKYYISKIISSLNGYQGEPSELLDLVEGVKSHIAHRAAQIRDKYRLPAYVPEWSSFNSVVVNNCYSYRRNRTKLTYSLINQWIQEFKETATTLKGFTALSPASNQHFRPIILVLPPH